VKKILFVDDEPEILSGLKNLLRRRRREWQMNFALGGEKALSMLADERFDVVVSDMRMPGIDGVAVLEEVQRRYPDTARIVLSGFSDQDMALRAASVAHQFLSKPCETDTLTNVIERACDLQELIGDEAIRKIVGQIDTLPALPQVYTALTRALSGDDCTSKKIASILQQDMAVCAKLLQMVNSSFFRLARQVSSIEEAVTYLGIATVKSLTLAAKVFDDSATKIELSGLSIPKLQEHALHVAALSKYIAPQGKKEDAFTAGMLHDIGLLILGVGLPRQLEEAMTRARHEGRPLNQVEYELFGTSHAEIGAYLLGLWGLPYPVVEAVAHHHLPQRVPQQEFDLLAIVHTAVLLAQEAFPDCRLCAGMGSASEGQDYWQKFKVEEQVEAWREFARRQGENQEER